MARTVSDQIIERPVAWGVRRAYGYPGDGIGGPQALEIVKSSAREWWDGLTASRG
jgi:hypothetical protein